MMLQLLADICVALLALRWVNPIYMVIVGMTYTIVESTKFILAT